MESDRDAVVISGISGRFPDSDDIQQLWSNLMSGCELSSTDARRWPFDVFDLPRRSGKIKQIEKFDAEYFAIANEDAHNMDPQIRLLHETTWEAIYDSGLNPDDLRGSKTSVYIGACFSDTALALTEKNIDVVNFVQAMAGRISYAFDFRGPALLVDTACASAFSAFIEACISIRKGVCENVVVAGLSVTLNPAISFGFKNIRMISNDGRSKCLDKDVNGYCRSETVVSLFLQKRKNAKRIYASVINGRTNTDGYKQEGITFPRSEAQQRLMQETIAETKIDPNDVKYIEAHMTGTAVGDPAESRAIIESYRPNGSEKPLLFGCLKSNLGHTEGASGCVAITKVCLAFQQRKLPPNINFKTPNPNIDALMKGIIEPVLEPREFHEDIVPVNSFGFGGVNVHVILKANEKSMLRDCDSSSNSICEEIPRIIAVSGRQQETVEFTFKWIEENKDKVTPEFLALLNDVSKLSPERGNNGRGYLILDHNGIKERKITEISTRKPLVLNFTSDLIENKSALKELLQLKPFKESINYASEVLQTVNLDLLSLLNSEQAFKSFSERVLTTAVTQIAIVDTLKYLEVKADKIVADSIGQISGDYFDDCLSAKGAILIAYWISRCFNLPHSAQCDQHSISALNELMKGSKRRSSKWVNGWADSLCSLESYTNKIDENVKQFIPENAFVAEISGNKITQSSLFTMFGDLYNSGYNLMFEKLYRKVEYPVSRETASLSNLWKWNHQQNWLVTMFPDYFSSMKLSKKVTVDLTDPLWKAVDGHSIDKRLLFPATAYLYMIWGTLASTIDNLDFILNFSIEFKDVKFQRATIVPKIGTLQFVTHYSPETGDFEIIEGGSVCVTGRAKIFRDEYNSFIETPELENNPSAVTLSTKEIYRELRTRGYDYGPNFRLLAEAKSDGTYGKLKWNGSWINFVDSVLQLTILEQSERFLYIPTSIEYMKVNADLFRKMIESVKDESTSVEVVNTNRNYLVANGAMIIKNIIGTPTARRVNDQTPDLEQIRFTPFTESVSVSDYKMNKICDYTSMCKKVIEKIIQCRNTTYEPNGDSYIKEFIENSQDDPSLLKMLYETLTENSHFENGLVEKYKKEISKDFLLHVTRSELFRPFVDLILENVFSKAVNVVECNLSTNYLYEYLDEEFARNYVNLNYRLLHKMSADYSNVPSSSTLLWRTEENIESMMTDIDLVIWRDFSNSLIIAKDFLQETFDLKSFLSSSFASIKPGGFLLLNFREQLSSIEKQIIQFQSLQTPQFFTSEQVKQIAETSQFCFIGERIDQLGNVAILLRKLSEQKPLETQTVVDLRTYDYEWVDDLKAAVKNQNVEKIWLRAADSEYNGVLGLFNCLKREIGESKLRFIYGKGVKLTQELLDKDLVSNVFKNGIWGSMRHIDIDINEHLKETEYAYLDVQTKGDLSSLKWHESHLKLTDEPVKEDEIVCNVAYAALNFKDVMVSSGKVPLNAYPVSWQNAAAIGMEFSGRDENYNRICGICEGGAIASKVVTKKYVWEVPSNWTLEEAATVPVVYLTVYYALFIRAKIQRNETVLIHAGSGGVGQAAIAVCLKLNCTVYTTVGTEEKKQFLLRKFPELNESQIGNSRDQTFEEMIMKATNGRGVDIVLNSLAEEKLRASVRCLAEFGRFVEIGKYDIVINSPLEPYLLEKNITFHVICVAHLMDEMREKSRRGVAMFNQLHALLEKGMRNGEIQPLERQVFEKEEYEEAIRFMANGKHIGKVLLKIDDDENDRSVVMKAIPRTYFHSKKTYILIGGLGGFGLEVAFWMVSRGARKLVLTSRNGVKENYQQYAINRLESKRAKVVVIKNDATDEAKVKEILAESQKLGEIGGIFVMSLILKDNLLEDQTAEVFREVCACKVNTTTLFDSLTRKMNIKLDYFVCFSSMVASIGNRAQTNYAFANAVMDRICEKRRTDGLHGLSIQWGLIGDVGFVAEKFSDKNIVLRGSVAQRMPSCLQTLDRLLQTDYPVCVSMVRVKDSYKSMGKDDLRKQICHVLGIKNPDKVNLSSTLGELGLDSLMAVEIKQTLERDYDLELSILEIRNLSLKQLMEIENNSNKSSKKSHKDHTAEGSKVNVWDSLLSVASTTFVNLNSQTDGLPLFFVPPVDGHFNLMLPLANLSRPVIGLNWTAELDNMSSITKIASFYAEQLYKTYPQHEYEIIGYSFGAVIALELCNQLQLKYGESVVKKVILLDGSAKMLKAQIEEIYTSNEKGDEAESFWDYLGYNLNYENKDRVKLREEIHALSTKEEKTQKLAEIVSAATGKECNQSLLISVIERFAKKSKLIYCHKPSKKFVGTVKLLRAKEKSLVYNFKDINEADYGLSQDVEGNVNTVILEGFHETFIAENVKKILQEIEDEFTFFLV